MKYYVEVPEVHIAFHEVKAKSKKEAIQKAQDGDSNELIISYSHSLEIENVVKASKDMDNSFRKYKYLFPWLNEEK